MNPGRQGLVLMMIWLWFLGVVVVAETDGSRHEEDGSQRTAHHARGTPPPIHYLGGATGLHVRRMGAHSLTHS